MYGTDRCRGRIFIFGQWKLVTTQTQGFTAGQVIQGWTKPFLKYLFPDEIGERCANCFKPAHAAGVRLLRCSACRINHYCSKECQKEDWKFAHSAECKMDFFRYQTVIMRHQNHIHPQHILMVTRSCAHLQMHPDRETQRHRMYGGSGRAFSALQSHANDGDQKLQQAAGQMSAWMGSTRWNTTAIRKILGIWKTNAITILDEKEEQGIGGALYLEGSVFDHSCRPNAIPVGDAERCLEVRCIADIAEGGQVFISYLPGILRRETRQKYLKENFNFECKCELCETEKGGRPATNYVGLLTMKTNIHCHMKISGCPLGTIVSLREEGIRDCTKLFHPYDDRVTNFATGVFSSVAEHYLGRAGGGTNEDVEAIQQLADDTLERLGITFGTGHEDYKKARGNMIRFNLRVPPE